MKCARRHRVSDTKGAASRDEASPTPLSRNQLNASKVGMQDRSRYCEMILFGGATSSTKQFKLLIRSSSYFPKEKANDRWSRLHGRSSDLCSQNQRLCPDHHG